MEPRLRNPGPNPSGDADQPSPSASRDQSQRDGSVIGETTLGRQHDVVKHRPQEPAFQTPIPHSMGAMPVEVGQSQKRTTGRTLSGQSASYHVDGYGAPSEPLKKSYGPQSKSYGCTDKETVRPMGTTALSREGPSTYALGSGMAKGDAGRQVRQVHKPMTPLMPAHGMICSISKQSYFPAGEAYYVDCPCHSDVCRQKGLQQLPGAYYSPHPETRGECYCKLPRSFIFKPESADERFHDQYTAEQLHWMATKYHEYVEFRRKEWAVSGGYPGDEHCTYDGLQQGQQHVVHVVEESGRSEAYRGGGDAGIFKFSSDSCLKSITVPAYLSNMFVSVRDTMTGGDTPLRPSYTEVSQVEPDAVLNDRVKDKEELSTSSSSAASAGTSDSEFKFKAESENRSGSEPESNAVLNVTHTIGPPDEAAPDAFLLEVHSCVQQPHEQEPQIFLQNPLLQPFQQQYPRPPMPIPTEHADPQGAYQKCIQQHYTGKAYRLSYQAAQQMINYHQECTNSEMGHQERDAYAAPRNGRNRQVPLRMPAERANLRSFHSQSSANIGNGETEEDTRSLLSRTNMRTPLLSSTFPGRESRGRTSCLFIALLVIVFSVLASVVVAFIIQQVVND